MSLLHSISDFIELYLSIDLPKKEIDLIKVRSFCEIKNEDSLEQTVNSFRKAITNTNKHYSKHRTKAHYALPEKLESLLHLSPEEFLILVGGIRYGLSLDALSLILKRPIETIRFRIEHLRNSIQLSEHEIKEIHLSLKPLEKRRFSQIQKIKNKIKPQRYLWESMIIMFSIIMVLWSIPALRGRYENWIQKKTSEYFVSGAIKEAPIPPELDTKPNVIEPEAINTTEEPLTTDSAKAERKQPKASDGEVWRFSFTGSAKLDLEKELKSITEKYASQPPRTSRAPGGIQYDAFVKVSELIPLKMAFEAIADTQTQTLKMSWYKKKGMPSKKVPSGHVEVVIWISTI